MYFFPVVPASQLTCQLKEVTQVTTSKANRKTAQLSLNPDCRIGNKSNRCYLNHYILGRFVGQFQIMNTHLPSPMATVCQHQVAATVFPWNTLT